MTTDIRKGMPDPHLDAKAFRERFLAQFYDPAFDPIRSELERVCEIAWEAYRDKRKAPRTRKAGAGFSDPDYDLSIEWIAAREGILEAQKRHEDRSLPSRVLLINGSPRSEHTCPGEMSKSWRLLESARSVLQSFDDTECEVLDLSRLTSEFGRHIHPCKACFSTSPALCHWPCSCYPNHAVDQIHDWMNEIYPMWVAAHGIMVITPVHWYQATTVLKAMLDRLVCADGGNPDPTSTHGKDAKRARAMEKGWSYPRHLAGRVFSIIVHGDTAGVEPLRRMLTDTLTDMQLRPAGEVALVDRYIGYYKPYSTSHAELDADDALHEEIGNAARALHEGVLRYRRGEHAPGAELKDPRPK